VTEPNDKTRKRYVYLRERMEKWDGWYELVFIVLLVLACIAYAAVTNEEIRAALWRAAMPLFGIPAG
jgi:hypothetical protein